MKRINNSYKIFIFLLFTVHFFSACVTKRTAHLQQKSELTSVSTYFSSCQSLDSVFHSINLMIDSVQIVEPMISTTNADSCSRNLQRTITLKGVKLNDAKINIKVSSNNNLATKVDSLQSETIEDKSTAPSKPDASPLIFIFLLGVFTALAAKIIIGKYTH